MTLKTPIEIQVYVHDERCTNETTGQEKLLSEHDTAPMLLMDVSNISCMYDEESDTVKALIQSDGQTFHTVDSYAVIKKLFINN